MEGTPDAAKTVEAAQAFERIAKSHVFTICHYHTDKELFDTHKFKAKVGTSNQNMSFCGVNSHHKNGKAENQVRDITIATRTSLLHAAHRRPNKIHSSLWTAAIKNYTKLRNSLPMNFAPSQRISRNIVTSRYNSSPLSRLS